MGFFGIPKFPDFHISRFQDFQISRNLACARPRPGLGRAGPGLVLGPAWSRGRLGLGPSLLPGLAWSLVPVPGPGACGPWSRSWLRFPSLVPVPKFIKVASTAPQGRPNVSPILTDTPPRFPQVSPQVAARSPKSPQNSLSQVPRPQVSCQILVPDLQVRCQVPGGRRPT